MDLSALDKILSGSKNKKGALVTVLQKVQAEYGWVPPETIEPISKALKVSPSEVYGVLTFYSQFYLKPRGRHCIQVCLGTACYVKRSEDNLRKIIDEINVDVCETTEDLKYSLEAVRCLGACGLAPVVAIGHDIHGNVKPKRIKDILKNYS
jgi:NADH:ubiquinone oxidoreductase subunit E